MDTQAFPLQQTDGYCVTVAPLARFDSLLSSTAPDAPASPAMPHQHLALLLAAAPALARGVYCLRQPIGGLWAYYALTSEGQLLHPPRPAELGLDTAFVVNGLREELDLVDPPTPLLRLIDGGAADPPSALAAGPRSLAPTVALLR
jgi:hypothetical protein